MADTSVKVFSSSDPGAPVLSGLAGALIPILKACLVEGRGLSGVVSLTVAEGIATATYAAGHPFSVGSVGLFAGAAPAGLNGEQRILTTSTNSVTFAATGIADGAATGSITSKLASAGWQQLFSGTNLLALKPNAVEATGCVLRVDDTGASNARIVGYESMSDVNTGVGPFPTNTMAPGGTYWWRSDSGTSAARPWRMYADGRFFYLWVAAGESSSGRGSLMMFGDINSFKSGDAWACVTNGMESTASTSVLQPGCAGVGNASTTATAGFVIARNHLALGGAQMVTKSAAYNFAQGYSATPAYNPTAMVFPNGADNSLRLAPVEVLTSAGVRGTLPGLYHSPQMLTGFFRTGDAVQGTGAFEGRRFSALVVGPPIGGVEGVVFIDITGWR